MCFWTEADDRHKEIAKTYYEHIEYEHPTHLTGRTARDSPDFCGCSWCAHVVQYPSYNGPSVQNIR